MEDITSAVLEQLSVSCIECGITSDIIDRQSFSCYSESPTYVTYRARLEGTSETDSGSLISLIEEWVLSNKASIIVTGVLMRVDSECSVAISSFGEGKCPTQAPTPERIPDTKPPTIENTTDAKPPVTDNTTDTRPIPFPDSNMDTEGPSTQTSTDNTAAIIGGVVAVVLIITIGITVVIVVLVMKNRRGDLSIKNTEK